MTRYFDDVTVGDTFESQGSEDITREDILSFARAWDPQAYHIDEEAAKASFAGGLSASAIHTLAVSQKLVHQSGFFDRGTNRGATSAARPTMPPRSSAGATPPRGSRAPTRW